MPFPQGVSHALGVTQPVARPPGLARQFRDIRARTERLAAPLSAEDCALQSMPDASPTKWHLAHTSWFFETFVLERVIAGYVPFHPHFRMLFNSYYVAVGPRHPRPERGLLSRPALHEVQAYRRHVNEEMVRILEDGTYMDSALAEIIELGIHHEQQHQELMLTDLKHLLSRNPLHPTYVKSPPLPAQPLCHAALAHPRDLPQFLPRRGALAIQRHPARTRSAIGSSTAGRRRAMDAATGRFRIVRGLLKTGPNRSRGH